MHDIWSLKRAIFSISNVYWIPQTPRSHVLRRQEKRTYFYRFIRVKVKLTLEQAREAQRGINGMARLFLWTRR